ncbi:MAG: RNB domain-containing ribonuclease [Treponema sp.]|nr:RNB domain-containing ribonuclease [Treponema sp.]
MYAENALAVYKNKPALIKERIQDKISIETPDGARAKVREKDIEVIHPGPVKNFNNIADGGAAKPGGPAREAWELLLTDGGAVTLKELAELAFGEYSPASAWAAYGLLLDGLYFSGTAGAATPRLREQVEADERKRGEKSRADGERGLFLERLVKRGPFQVSEGSGDPSGDRRYIQDIEALAYGKTAKSRTMKDIGLGETPEEAHALLLECGFWTERTNPHPCRFGVSLLPAKNIPDAPPAEERRDLTRLAAFAIDSPWSHDPDDAVSLETEGSKQALYVHVADPAASISAGSPAEIEARDRGATLYIPEGCYRMLAEEALPLFCLGYGNGQAANRAAGEAASSAALTFKITLNESGEIEETEIFPSLVKVKRLTYREADSLAEKGEGAEAPALRALGALAGRNFSRRAASGAIDIDMPEIHISAANGKVLIEPVIRYRSAITVRECMILAGEGAGIWAMQRSVPVPYVVQETGEIPEEILPGFAGAYQLRRCMRPRILSAKPGRHQGLGLAAYTQTTSPLRRYNDLLTHMQIRAFLRGGPPLSPDETTSRMFAGEAAAAAVTQAERASRCHWTMVYLSGKKDSVWEAAALEKKGNRWTVIIPDLALETQVPLREDIAPNERLKLVLKSVNIPRGEAVFAV